jgi:hypothetical protein
VCCVTAGLHSSVEESDSDGYARGRAYSRRSNVPSYAAPSDPYVRAQPPSHMRHTLKETRALVQPPTHRGHNRLDVYAEVKESAEESGATSNDAPPPTLDELWAGLNDNQAFQSKLLPLPLLLHRPYGLSVTQHSLTYGGLLQASSSSFCS